MNAKELMICDWVVTKLAYQMQVLGLENGLINGTDEDDIEPIPLTEDIILKNGCFDPDVPDGVIFGGDIGMFWYDSKGTLEFGNCFLRYVHELQHALRLCGLNELADNFKIE